MKYKINIQNKITKKEENFFVVVVVDLLSVIFFRKCQTAICISAKL